MIVTLGKIRSPITVTIEQDPEDLHFFNITELKHGTVVRTHYVIAEDLQQWVDMYGRQGFCAKRDKSDEKKGS